MRRFLTTLMAVILLSCFICATAEAYDITGDWTEVFMFPADGSEASATE
jgi:hypothetical protein